MEIKTLSFAPGIPFNDTFESFCDKYRLDEDIECYQLFFCPWGNGTSFEDLDKINFKSRVVILNIIDSIIDKFDNTAIKELKDFCRRHPEHNFIVSSPHFNIKRELSVPNLYLDEIMPTMLTEPFRRCEKKEISNKFVSFSNSTKLHRVLTISYLLSKDYGKNGDFTFNFEHELISQPQVYKNLGVMSDELKASFAKGHELFKNKDFNRLEIEPIQDKDLSPAKNYNEILSFVYENYAIEIVTGTMFFEKSPVLSEKEMQSVYSKNFPIFLNGVGMAKEMKKFFDIDLFEDIIDHSYDGIENHFERLAAAIDRNEKLLNGSMNIQELWFDNRHRFDYNCDKIQSMLFDGSYQKVFNFKKIRQALTHFNVTLNLR
jgi:hypothetical protein